MKEFIEKLIGRLEEREAELKTITAECKPTKEMRDKNYGYYTAMNHAKEIVNQLAEEYNNGWILCSEKLPPHSDELLLIQCSGKPKSNIVLDNAFCLASYTEEGWILEMYPEWEDAEVVAWKDLGEPYQPKGE